MREYALSFPCFCQKTQFDIQKNLLLSKMAKLGDARSPRSKKSPMLPKQNMTLGLVINDGETEGFVIFQDYAGHIRAYLAISIILYFLFYFFYDIKENIKRYIKRGI
jgi:hypothetical protein